MHNESMLSLLRFLAYTLNGVEWKGNAPDFAEFLKVAQQQTVSAFLVDAPPCMLSNYDKRQRLLLVAEAFSLEQMHQKTNATICRMAKQMEAKGIRYCLLKGQNCASRYPKPERRNVGDIDLYIAPDDFKKATELFLNDGFKKTENTWLHLTLMNKEGCTVELHHTLQRMQWPKHNAVIKRLCHDIAFDNYITINGQKICVLPTELDMIMLTIHPLTHLMGEGIGLRHICDWMMRLKYCFEQGESIDKEKLHEMLHSLHLLKMWRVLACICVANLGLPVETTFVESEFSTEEKRLAEMVLDRIATTGNFGANIDLQGRSKRLMGRYSLFLTNSIRFRKIVPQEALATPISKTIEGLQQRLYNKKNK